MGRSLHIVDDDGQWPVRFATEAERITRVLGSDAKAIEHIGSTAVPGLPGKPVLDIGVAVESEKTADACIGRLEALGYEYRGQHGDDPRRRYYVLQDSARRLAQLHLYILPALAWEEHLLFRDALRADPELAAAYAAEKYRVAEAVAWNKGAYAIAKGPFIRRVLTQLHATRQPES